MILQKILILCGFPLVYNVAFYVAFYVVFFIDKV